MDHSKIKGYFLAALAAATYGTNPVFAIPLYDGGMNANSVLLFRYLLSLPMLAVMARVRGRSLRLPRHSIVPVCILGVLMGMSSLSLFVSYNYMNAGVASTLLFVYPVMVAMLMILCFGERFKASTAICLALMAAGLLLMMRTDGGPGISMFGCVAVGVSSLTYAIYIVMTNVSKAVKGIPTLALLFWELLSGSMVFVFMVALGTPLTLPSDIWQWGGVTALALLPTAVSLTCTTMAIQSIGSTPTAILGALEPVTAVVLSVVVLGQGLTPREMAGGLLIVAATTLVVAGDGVDHVLLGVRRMFPAIRHNQSK